MSRRSMLLGVSALALTLACGQAPTADHFEPPPPSQPPPPPPPPAPPKISGNFSTYNKGVGHLGELKVSAVGSDATDIAQVSSTGTWSVTVTSKDQCVLLTSSDPNGVFRPWENWVCRSEFGNVMNYTQVPKPRLIVGGWRNGALVNWSLVDDGWRRSSDSLKNIVDGITLNPVSSLIMRRYDQGRACWILKIGTFPKEKRPVPTAFDRGPLSALPVSIQDSAAEWQKLAAAQAELGVDLWRPANFSELGYTLGQNNSESWMGTLIRATTGGALGSITRGAEERDAVSAAILISPQAMYTVTATHEGGHSVGLGHSDSTAYGTAMAPSNYGSVFGEKIVAVFQTLYDDGDTRRATGAKSGIPGALSAELRARGTPQSICDQ